MLPHSGQGVGGAVQVVCFGLVPAVLAVEGLMGKKSPLGRLPCPCSASVSWCPQLDTMRSMPPLCNSKVSQLVSHFPQCCPRLQLHPVDV